MEESFAPRKNEKNAPSDTSSSTTDLSLGYSDSNQFEQIDIELMQLEQRLVNIEMRIKEDVEAEEIGIEVFAICLEMIFSNFYVHGKV
ncbi:unnamed protein product [Brugia pahangi]|uniref:Ovule protein n=1 Tax=Brugia pahangi TaxID=6280 RepID=A0A0N4TG74_BRUPA|nr:unnamed protein product [Brugia pahangi]